MKHMRIIILLGLCILINFLAFNKYKEYMTIRSIADKIIRFHVIANSDSQRDQSLKLKVRDSVLKYMYPKLENAESIEECRKILMKEEGAIVSLSENIIANYGYDYEVKTELANEKFPDKTYGNITLPQGEYEAFRIIIGEGSGQNWWCVMFPPLCLVDMEQGETAYVASETQMRRVLDEKEYNAIDNTKHNKNNNEIGNAKDNQKDYNIGKNRNNSSEENKISNNKSKKNNRNNIKFKFKILEVIENML